jgi:hypothetical protein
LKQLAQFFLCWVPRIAAHFVARAAIREKVHGKPEPPISIFHDDIPK